VRILAIAVSIALAGCTTSPFEPPDSIEGTWSNETRVETPAGPLVMTLSQSGDSVSGSAWWATFTYNVSGSYDPPNVTLTLSDATIDGERVSGFANQTWTGMAVGDYTLVLSDGQGTSGFHRQ
jgi:hypothetical protein